MNIIWVSNLTEESLFKTSKMELSQALRKRGHKITLVMARNVGERKKSNEDNIIYIPTFNLPILSGLMLLSCQDLLI